MTAYSGRKRDSNGMEGDGELIEVYDHTNVEIILCSVFRLCLNGGTCVDGVNAYRCRCVRSFTGKNCHIEVELDIFKEAN